MPTTWRVLDRIDADHLGPVRAARAVARERAWAAGAGPDLSQELRLDFDATITIAHGEKENAGGNVETHLGFHPLLCFLDRPEIASGEALAGLQRRGNAGSNTAVDHIMVLDMALGSLPECARPRPGDPDSPRLLARSDSAGATHAFAEACVERGVGFSFGFPRRYPHPTHRRRHPRPLLGAGNPAHRITAFLTNTAPQVVPGQAAGLELRHRQHARVEDRIRQAKATGLRNFPCRGWNENNAWLETVLTAVDLVCWTKLICFDDVPDLARCEIAAFRYRILRVAARLTRSARQLRLRIDATWRWATHIAEGFHRLRAAFTGPPRPAAQPEEPGDPPTRRDSRATVVSPRHRPAPNPSARTPRRLTRPP